MNQKAVFTTTPFINKEASIDLGIWVLKPLIEQSSALWTFIHVTYLIYKNWFNRMMPFHFKKTPLPLTFKTQRMESR